MLHFQRGDASARVRYVAVPPLGRRTVTVKGVPEMALAEFSTVIESDQQVVVDRTMTWDATGYGSHAETSIATPATVWYLAEGATHSGFSLFYLVQNPHPTAAAQVLVRYLRPTGVPLEKLHTVPPHSRYNIWVNLEQIPEGSGQLPLASTDVSAVIASQNGVPVIVERAMYLDRAGQFFGAGHEGAGITAPATTWFLAEGATGAYFDLFILVANPSAIAAPITATYLLPDGATIVRSYAVAANSRFNIWVDLEDPLLADTAVSTTIESTAGVPIIVERAMWWPGPSNANWAEAHNSAGSTVTGVRWALAEGEQGGPRAIETYILVANTSPSQGQAKVTLLFEDGTTTDAVFTLPANSRTNVNIGAHLPQAVGRRFGAVVERLERRRCAVGGGDQRARDEAPVRRPALPTSSGCTRADPQPPADSSSIRALRASSIARRCACRRYRRGARRCARRRPAPRSASRWSRRQSRPAAYRRRAG
jgi:hypothetical protein